MKRKSGRNPRQYGLRPYVNAPFVFSSRLKGQYDAELREMERVERQSREKYNESRSKLAESEANVQNLHASVKQLEIQLNHAQRVSPIIPKYSLFLYTDLNVFFNLDVRQLRH